MNRAGIEERHVLSATPQNAAGGGLHRWIWVPISTTCPARHSVGVRP
jgi:hypothetical protein